MPGFEGLEGRIVLSTIYWDTADHPTGGAWDTATNWQGGAVPGPNDTAIIDLPGAGTITTGPSDSVLSLTTNASTTVSVSNGSLTLGAATFSIDGPIAVSSTGTLALSGATLIGSGTVTDAGRLTTIGSASTALASIAMSSGSTSNLINFTVQSGATVSMGTNVTVTIGPATGNYGVVTLSDSGTLSFAANDTVTFNDNGYYYGAQIVVNSGGLLQATGTSFNATNGNNSNGDNYTQIAVNSGGHLTASTSTFALGSVSLADGVVFNAGDLTGNGFDSPLYIPAVDVQYLANNLRFQSVLVNADTIASGQTLALNAIGTQTTTNLRYVFPAGLTINQGGTVTAAAGVPVTIGPATSNGGLVTLSDSGTLSFAANDTVTFNDNGYYYGAQIVVNSGGLLQATGTSFNATNGNNSNGGNYTQIVVISGGQLTASTSTSALGNLILNSNSTDTLQSNVFDTALSINSGATISITGNDFSNATVVASGDPSAFIDLRNNFWGTTTATQIAAKITDHVKNSALPTVLYNPYENGAPTQLGTIQGVVFNDVNGDGVQKSGEPGLAGVVVYIDANDNGALDSGEVTTVTESADPTDPATVAGGFSFAGLTPGTYVVREQAPVGTVETTPSAASVANTMNFDGLTAGTSSSFTDQGATFSGGTVFAPSQSALLASGSLAYNVSSGNAEVDFLYPISSVSFFYVSGDGFAAGTATAFGADGSTLGSVSSNAATKNDDPANFVTMSFSQPIARITFSGGVVDSFTFTTQANDQAEFVRVTAGGTVSGIDFGNQSTAPSGDLVATSVTPTSNGFTATFSAPLNTAVLNLYDTAAMGPADVTLVGQSTGPVSGSLVVSPNGESITFISTAGLLAPDTYTITLVSGANAFVSTTGALLDGNGDGTPGDDLTYTFTVSPMPSNAVVVSIPDFTRGFGQTVDVPASSTAGLPITLSTGQDVTGVDLTLLYNPALLTITGFSTSIPGASAVFNVVTPGQAILTISSASPFSAAAGALTLGDLAASVPDNAPYRAKEILQITDLTVFDDEAIPQPLPAIAQDAIHVAAYFGDTSGDETYSTPDVTLEQRYIGEIIDGFPNYPLVDPILIGDVTMNGLIQANDTTSIQRVIGQVSVPTIPALPTGISPAPNGGPDPTIFIPDEQGNAGDTITVPVEMTVTEPAGITVSGFQVAIAYDPNEFTVGAVAQLGSAFSASLGFAGLLTFPSPGVLIFNASSGVGTGTIADNTTTDLFTLSFTVNANAANGSSVINLLQNYKTTATAIFDNNLDQLTLSPAPTNAATDPVDGIFTVGTATTKTTAAAASSTFSTGAVDVPLSASVTSAAGTVDEGTETFTILEGTTPVGTAVTVDVVAGVADATYVLPAGTPGGTYIIQAVYNGTADFGGSSDDSQSLIVAAAASATAAASASATFSTGAVDVPLSATVTSAAGTVDEGTETFTILEGTTPVGVAVTVNVVAGVADATYVLPAGTPGGTYIIQAVFNGTPDFLGYTDDSHTLIVSAAASATAAASASATFSTGAVDVPLSATVTSAAGTVDEGTETFTILEGTTPIGVSVTVNVAAGLANATYVLPAGTAADTYTIQAAYNGTNDFGGSTDTSHHLTVSGPTISVVAEGVQWGSDSAALQMASDGVRLLPAGRSTDLPWLGINRIDITLSQAATIIPGDVSVTGVAGGDYGPVTISGSGTSSLVITLARPINDPDRVTLAIGNDQIIAFKGRLDVLPGDVNDDGVVNTTDGTLILYDETPAHTYQVDLDINGDGAVNVADFSLDRARIGDVLPGELQDTGLSGQDGSDPVAQVLGAIDPGDFAAPATQAGKTKQSGTGG